METACFIFKSTPRATSNRERTKNEEQEPHSPHAKGEGVRSIRSHCQEGRAESSKVTCDSSRKDSVCLRRMVNWSEDVRHMMLPFTALHFQEHLSCHQRID
jgi:hypothetical protein